MQSSLKRTVNFPTCDDCGNGISALNFFRIVCITLPFGSDFGLAREFKEKHRDGTYKLTGNTGSRRYMAMEVSKAQVS